MGFKNLSNIKFAPEYDSEVVRDLHSLAKFCVLESFEPSYYATADEHALKALEKHRTIYEKYPQLYDLMFASEELTSRFLDAHLIVSAMYATLSGVSESVIFETLKKVQINRVFLYFLNALSDNVSKLLNAEFSKRRIREMFYRFMTRFEAEETKERAAFFAVKYRRKLQRLFAVLRIKRKNLSEFWKEAADLLFVNKTKRKEWSYEVFREISELRRKSGDLKKVKKIPFSNYLGYVWRKLRKQQTPEEIKGYLYGRTDLMSNNEVKRALAKLQEAGKLEDEETKKKITTRVIKLPLDAFSLLSALYALKGDAKEIALNVAEKSVKKVVEKLKLSDKKIGIAVDVSANTKGYKFSAGDKSFTMRRSVDKNLLIGFVLAKASKLSVMLVFNENYGAISVAEMSIKDFVEDILKVKPNGGSAPAIVLKELAELESDMIIMISDFNENVPMRGYMPVKLVEIAKKYKKPIFLLQTELDVSELSALESVIAENKLDNVYLLPIRKLEHLVQIIETLELDEELKRLIVEVLKKKKTKAAEIYA